MRRTAVLTLLAAACAGWVAAQEFVLGSQGCPMAHCDARMSDAAGAPAPTGEATVAWRNDVAKGSRSGLGCASNGVIAACTFNDEAGDNVVAYDYDGRRLWSSGVMVNHTASTSAPMVAVDGSEDVIRLAEADGGEIERISIDDLVARPGPHGPGSAMTIAGTSAAPVMLVAAKTYFGSSFVLAVDLEARSLVWKALVSARSRVNRGSTSGQFPIVLGPEGPRVVFSSWDLGVFAVGEAPPALR